MNVFDQPIAEQPLILILGLGETGVAAARWCARQGSALRIADTRSAPAGLDGLRSALSEHEVNVDYHLNCGDCFDASLLDGVTQIVLSPGLAPNQAPAQSLLQLAAERGIEVVGEIELFARALTQLASTREYTPKVLAITGTNGKTTVTAMTRQLVEAGGFSVRAAGNISPAALASLMDALDTDDLPQVWVLELSSFQLETTVSLAPDAATVLNVTQDHLDWHGDIETYASAKARLLALSDVSIINRDDPRVAAMVDAFPALNVRTFGRDLPEWVGDMGIEFGQGMSWLVASEPTDFDEFATPIKRKKNAPPPQRVAGRMSRLMPSDALRVRGLHNALNALAALQLARVLNIGWGPMLRALRDYSGEPHRAAFVRAVSGVDYINDSKGTNVGATVAALEGLGQPVVLIAGGLGKGQDFSPLSPVVARYARAVVLIGTDGPEIGRALVETGVPCVMAQDMRHAVRLAAELAELGDAVLLSPACASMDMFRNYPHRGAVFVEEVNDLALDNGEV